MTTEHHRVIVVGAGFAGMGASIALARAGVEHVVLERAADVGGTWRDNTYPGCRCDVPSHLYSFSFALNPGWSETYSPQPEIQAYLRRTAQDHGVVERTRFDHTVRDAAWDAAAARWRLDTNHGELTCDVLLLGNGPLAEPALPDIPGLESFAGQVFHSARWPDGVDLTGRSVAVIGTGASAIQFVPRIQPQVEHLTVFQRTPGWILPHRNRVITDRERWLYRRVPAVQRVVRGFVYWTRELTARGFIRNRMALVEKLARKHLESQVADPELRAKLTPTYNPGCKRLLPSNDWYPALQQPNVDLVTEKIVEIRPDAVVTADGEVHAADTLILGTGFRVLDNPMFEHVRDGEGRTLVDHWQATGARAYLGTTIDGFPNLFVLAGPNTGIGHTSLLVMIEAQLDYVLGAIRHLEATGARSLDLRPTAMRRWTHEVQRKSSSTVWSSGGCASWYLDAEGRNGSIWPDYTYKFVRRTKRFDAESYEIVGAS
jgi:cation diffusion facilitator CzcD-associated flavoprotein CzcO